MATSLNGSSDYLELTTSNYASTVTIACWFRAANTTTSMVPLSLGNSSGSDNDRLQLVAAGAAANDRVTFDAITNGGAVAFAETTASFVANTWCHVCGIMSSITSRTVRINGASAGTNATSRAITGLDRLCIGVRISGGSRGAFFNGQIAEVAVWSVDLTEAENISLAKGFRPSQIRPQSLVHYLPLVRNVNDIRGGGAITTVGSPTVADHPRIYG